MKCVLLLLLVIIVGKINAQYRGLSVGKIKGEVNTETTKQPLPNATISIFKASDSSLKGATLTDKRGAFVLDSLQVGDYWLHITYLGYERICRKIVIIEGNSLVDFGTIYMRTADITLGIVEIVEEKPSMVIKRDTLEFNVGSFKTRENAIVEELIKKLPGVHVEKDGTIKVNGETVKRLLVDGEPFFGDNPRLATRNLSVDMIDKVQFIDRRSDWSQFTGINDGQREKTINITIRKDKKDGYFGRISGTIGTQDHFAVNSNINRFNEEQRISFLANGTNINGYQDEGEQARRGIGGNSNVRKWNMGVNYNIDVGKKIKMRTNYSMNDNYTDDRRSSKRQNILPDSIWHYNKNSGSSSTNVNHALNTSMEFRPDTTYMLNVSATLGYGRGRNVQESMYTSLGRQQQHLNSGAMVITNSINTPNVSISAFLGKKFRKTGRTLGINVGVGYSTNDQIGFNKSRNVFLEPDGDVLRDSTDQRNDINSLNKTVTLSLTYTERLMKDRYLELTYIYSHDHGTSVKSTFDYDLLKNEYDRRNDSLSNGFVNRYSFQQTGIRVLTQKSKYDYNIGLNIQSSNLNNNNNSEGSQIKQHVVNLFPSAAFNYAISERRRVQFSYFGNTQQPSTAQLQPVPDNSNPLYIQLGNRRLKPAFSNIFIVNYTALNPIKLKNFSAGLSAGFIANKIVNASWFDSLGRQVSQPQNLNGAYNINARIATDFPLKKQHTSVNTNITLGFNRDVSYINNVKGDTREFNITSNLSFNYNYKELFDLGASTSLNYSKVAYMVQDEINNWFLNYNFSFDGNIHLPLGIVFGGSLEYMSNASKDGGYNQDAVMLNVLVAKVLFKQGQGLIRLQGWDLLNRNVGINRVVAPNYIEDIETNVMQRLYLISFSYFLRKVR